MTNIVSNLIAMGVGGALFGIGLLVERGRVRKAIKKSWEVMQYHLVGMTMFERVMAAIKQNHSSLPIPPKTIPDLASLAYKAGWHLRSEVLKKGWEEDRAATIAYHKK